MLSISCKFCDKEFNNIKSFTNHIWITHHVTIKEYYDKFCKDKYEEYCDNPNCINEFENRPNYTTFGGGLLGYRRFCSNHCASTMNNKTLFIPVDTSNLCEYGCGQIAKFENPISKKYCCSDIWEKCPSQKNNISKRFKGINRHHIAIKIETTKLCEYGCEEVAQYKFQNGKMCCSKHTSSCKARRKIAKKTLGNLYNDEIFLKKKKDGVDIKPNRVEIKLMEILNELFPNEFEYTGDFSFWVGTKNPDFKHKNDKKVIELFGDYWHSEEVTGINERLHEIERTNHFEQYGYNVLIIWENEIKNIERIKQKLINFNNGKEKVNYYANY